MLIKNKDSDAESSSKIYCFERSYLQYDWKETKTKGIARMTRDGK